MTSMRPRAHRIHFSGDFNFPVEVVFECFTNLAKLHLWNTGMMALNVSSGQMYKGLRYQARMVTAGEMTQSIIEITEFAPNRFVQMVNDAGMISYDAAVSFTALSEDTCRITCAMEFRLPMGFLPEAGQVAEEMAEARIRGNWELLKALLRLEQSAIKE